jgi:hypothetical protein
MAGNEETHRMWVQFHELEAGWTRVPVLTLVLLLFCWLLGDLGQVYQFLSALDFSSVRQSFIEQPALSAMPGNRCAKGMRQEVDCSQGISLHSTMAVGTVITLLWGCTRFCGATQNIQYTYWYIKIILFNEIVISLHTPLQYVFSTRHKDLGVGEKMVDI